MIVNTIPSHLRQNQAAKEGSITTMEKLSLSKPRFSDQTKDIALSIAQQYGSLTDDDVIYLADVPDEELLELAASIMSYDDHWASESLGVDNNAFNGYMLPALVKLMGKPADKDLQADYLEKLKKGLLSHFHNTMEELLTDALVELR